MKKGILVALGLAVGVLPACNDSTGPQGAPCDPFLLTFGSVGADTVTSGTGVRYVEVKTGTGVLTAQFGNVALVNFSVYDHVTGGLYQTTCSGSAATAFQIGDPRYFEGFSAGVVGMKTGGVRRVLVPSDLADGQGDLIFDLHLVQLQ